MKAYTIPSHSAPSRTKWQRFAARRLPTIVMALMVATLMAAVLYPHMVITVPTGHVGVLWKRLGGFGIYCWCVIGRGTVLEPRELREEGLHLVWPWNKLYLYDLRLQTTTHTYNAISKDGVSLTATINARFQLQHDSVAQVHKFIGPGYTEMVVLPEIGSRTREIISKFNAEEVYSSSRQVVEEAIRLSAQTKLRQQLNRLVQPESSDQFQHQANKPVIPELELAIDILDTLVLGIVLPDAVVTAINRKIEQLYIAQEYEFRILREDRESERKRIEAAGIRDFQQIVSQGISDSYLRWRGIEATLQLAQSHNAKTVIIGSNKDGLPIILGNADTPVQPAATPDGGSLPNRTTQATRPAMPNEKTPAAGLTTPAENTPANPPPAAAIPTKPQSFLPRSLSDIETMLFRTPWSVGPETAPAPTRPAETPATQLQR